MEETPQERRWTTLLSDSLRAHVEPLLAAMGFDLRVCDAGPERGLGLPRKPVFTRRLPEAEHFIQAGAGEWEREPGGLYLGVCPLLAFPSLCGLVDTLGAPRLRDVPEYAAADAWLPWDPNHSYPDSPEGFQEMGRDLAAAVPRYFVPFFDAYQCPRDLVRGYEERDRRLFSFLFLPRRRPSKDPEVRLLYHVAAAYVSLGEPLKAMQLLKKYFLHNEFWLARHRKAFDYVAALVDESGAGE
jgi:hypothetical protein